MDFVALQNDVRSRLIEASARYFTDAEIKRWLNLGYKAFLARTGWAERITGLAAVADQYEYDLASQTVKIRQILWEDQYRIVPKQQHIFFNLVGVSNTSESTRPEIYTAFPWYNRIRLYPIPSTASDSTTLNGAHNSTITTLTVAATSAFPTTGMLLVNSEQILYTGKTATTFTGCVRGYSGSTAASHSNTDSVKLASILVYNTYIPADMSADTDEPRVNEEFREALILYAVQIGLQKRQKFTESRQMLEMYLDMANRAEMERLRESLEGHHAVADADEIEDWY